MARQEYINELQIRINEILQELQTETHAPIIEELGAILKILFSNVSISSNKLNYGGQTKISMITGTPKGKMSWRQYVIVILKEIGGRGKARDVADAVIKANPKIDGKRALQAVRHHLSKLSLSGEIGANKSDLQSEGSEYYIK